MAEREKEWVDGTNRTQYSYHMLKSRNSMKRKNSSSTRAPVHDSTKSHPKWPKLTKEGYQVSPDLEVLQNMTEEELSKVSGFKIQNEWGSVEYKCSCDLREVDLDQDVVISYASIEVYPKESSNSETKRGDKLNNKATLTYERLPIGDNQEAEMIIRSKVASFDGKVLKYEPRDGRLVIEVPHFTKYDFVEELEEKSPGEEQKKGGFFSEFEKARNKFSFPAHFNSSSTHGHGKATSLNEEDMGRLANNLNQSSSLLSEQPPAFQVVLGMDNIPNFFKNPQKPGTVQVSLSNISNGDQKNLSNTNQTREHTLEQKLDMIEDLEKEHKKSVEAYLRNANQQRSNGGRADRGLELISKRITKNTEE